MTAPDRTPEERRRIETILDHHLYPEREKQWDTKCRVCGGMLMEERFWCSTRACAERPLPDKRADDPLPHTTSDAQMREDRERLPVELLYSFLRELRKLVTPKDESWASLLNVEQQWLLLNATPEQQAIAMARALDGDAKL